jgi:drug/metabolite transporter (DMT)-like permease
MTDTTATAAAPGAAGPRTEPAAHVALFVVQAMFSTLPIAAKYYVLPYAPPAGLVLLRVAGGAAVLLAVARAGARTPIVDRRDYARLALYAALGVAVNQLMFIEGLSRTTPVNAQIIGTAVPAFTLMFGVLLKVDRASAVRVAGIALAAAGAIYLVGPDRVRLSPETTAGNAMIAVNALAYSLYLVLVKPILAREDSLTVMALVFAFGALFVAPFGAVSLASTGALATMPASAWAGVAFIVLVPTAGSYWLNAWALGRSSPSVVATYMYLQPLLTGALAMGLMGEPLDARAVPSAALVFAGVALATRRRAS